MYVLNMRERTIKRFSNTDLAIWVNDLIKYNNSSLMNKTYLFVPTKKAVKYILKKNKWEIGYFFLDLFAWIKAIAIACLGFLTTLPFLPLFKVPALNSFITLATFLLPADFFIFYPKKKPFIYKGLKILRRVWTRLFQ